jgi:dipeptidyl aminopeptidase/acylaminoacyl peptidase
MSRSSVRRSSRARDPYGLLPDRSWLAPGLSVIGLLIVGLLTLGVMNGSLPFAGGSGGGGGGVSTRTAAPSNVVVVPEVTFPGSIVYAKAGNIWVQQGHDVRQLTGGGHDSMPSWAPDGRSVFFVRTTEEQGLWPAQGTVRHYRMDVPALMRVIVGGSAEPEVLFTGRIKQDARSWFYWIRQPVLSADGRTLAMISDGPDATTSDAVLQFIDLVSERRTAPDVPESVPLGHQDPSWRADGKFLLYVRNGRSGSRGAPVIYRWDVAKSTATPITGPGYLEPRYSPDGRYIAATKASALGNDVVILDAAHGRELLRVTDDGASWAPVWSPAGDAIAFLHIDGQIVDLKMARLDGAAPDWTVGEAIDLTQVSGLDGGSRPDWYVAPGDLPATPAPSVAPSTGAGSGGPAAS